MINMAQIQVVKVTDDIDGTESTDATPVNTVTFGLGRDTFEIDLTEANAEKLRGILGKYIAAGRKVSGARRGALRSVPTGPTAAPSGRARTTADREQNQKIREWGRARGFKVSERGALSAELRAAYDAQAGRPAERPAEAPKSDADTDGPNKAVEVLTDALSGGKKAPRKAEPKPKAADTVTTGKRTRIAGLSGFQVRTLAQHCGALVIDSGSTWALLEGTPESAVERIEAVRNGKRFEAVGEKRSLAFVVTAIKSGSKVKVVDAA